MTKGELQERLGLEADEVKSWKELSYQRKGQVVDILKENGFANAGEAIKDLTFNYEGASFGNFYLAVEPSDVDDMQSYF